ncbi:hypothetical protein QJQ45_028036, partial [Haematococcus lacustris]
GTLPFARDAVAASADQNPDYPGSCGRCYEVRCKSGPVLNNERVPIQIVYPNLGGGNISTIGYFDNDTGRPYLPSINPNVRDMTGSAAPSAVSSLVLSGIISVMVWLLRVPRPFPGNPGAPRNLIFTQCYDTAKVVRVRIVDSCPCVQVLPDGAPTVKPGGEVRRQEWCCGPVNHFDLSYWAFEQLAHPLFGAMMLEYRSVDCGEGFSVPSDYISPVIYGPRGIEPGWSWEPWSIVSAQLQVKGEWPGLHARTEAPRVGPTGGDATCMDITPGGGLTLRSRKAHKTGFQPLKGARRIDFWIKPNSGSRDPFVSSTPDGQVPRLKLYVMVDDEDKKEWVLGIAWADSVGNSSPSNWAYGMYCFKEVVLGLDAQPTARQQSWYKFEVGARVSMATFRCEGALNPDELNRVDFQNINERRAVVCFANVEIVT